MYTDEIICKKLERIEELLEQVVEVMRHRAQHAPVQVPAPKTSVNPVLITTKQAAEMTGLSKGWFDRKRVTGGGPPYLKMGGDYKGAVRYRLNELQEWLDKNKVGNTSEYDFKARQSSRYVSQGRRPTLGSRPTSNQTHISSSKGKG